MVLGEELEDDHVAHGDIVELIGLEDQTSRSSDNHCVCGSSVGDRGSLALGDGMVDAVASRDDGRVLASTDGDGLGDGHLLVVCGGGMLSSGVGPDDDDFRLGVSCEALALHALQPAELTFGEQWVAADGRLHHVGLADLAGQSQRRDGQCESLGELHSGQ